MRLNGAVYYYEIKDPQLTAIGGGGNFVQLLNADKGRAWASTSTESSWSPTTCC